MEHIDVLDPNGNPRGLTKPKADIHRDGDWHKATHVWILNSKGELLIQKRAMSKDSHPGEWDIPSAGHVSAGEDGLTTAVRETKEELGLELPKEAFELLFTVSQESTQRGGTYINREFNDVFLVRKDFAIGELTLQAEEVEAVRWIPFEELERELEVHPGLYVQHPEEYSKLFAELRRRLT